MAVGDKDGGGTARPGLGETEAREALQLPGGQTSERAQREEELPASVIGEPLPDWLGLLAGTAVIVAGLSFFIFGLEMALFPLGESMA